MVELSPKGYMAVPTEDDTTDNVGVQLSSQTANDAGARSQDDDRSENRQSNSTSDSHAYTPATDDDDDLYASHDPLLARFLREPYVFESRRDKFLRCIKRPFQIIRLPSFRVDTDRWVPSIKESKQRKILKWIIAFLLITTLAMTGTVIGLAVKLSGTPTYIRVSKAPCSADSLWKTTRIPRYNEKSSYAANNNLNFAETYPPLTPSSSLECHEAWRELKGIKCHEKIWNRSWDNGKHSLFDPEITHYVDSICTTDCLDHLKNAYRTVISKCGLNDKFDLAYYVGTFTADPELEFGPIAALETIIRRVQHTCRLAPQSLYGHESAWLWNDLNRRPRYGQYKYCTAQIYEDWFIIDGMNSDNLEGLETFDLLTSKSRIITKREAMSPGWRGDLGCDDGRLSQSSAFYYSERKFGPSPNETYCGSCLMDWFERKMFSWNKGVRDPFTGKSVSLPKYIRKISAMGQRCETTEWNSIYRQALDHYRLLGLLPSEIIDDSYPSEYDDDTEKSRVIVDDILVGWDKEA